MQGKKNRDSKIGATANTRHERHKARPDAEDLTDPKEVWKNSETTPQRDLQESPSEPDGRVADAGDIGGGQPSPYEEEVQADAVARQTNREERAGVEKPRQ
jgi:hypothetical protein